MEILPNEVESIKTIGSLNDEDVKIVKTYGGFFIAIGKKNKKNKTVEALAGGSHPALVSHQLTKEFKNKFQPAMCKSEADQLEIVDEFTQYLPSNIQNQGYELFTLSKKEQTNFIVSKFGLIVGEYNGYIENNDLVIKTHQFDKNINQDIHKELAEGMARMISNECNFKKLNLKI